MGCRLLEVWVLGAVTGYECGALARLGIGRESGGYLGTEYKSHVTFVPWR